MFVLLRRKSKQKIAYTLLYSNNFRYFNKRKGFKVKTIGISYVFSLFLSEMTNQPLLSFMDYLFYFKRKDTKLHIAREIIRLCESFVIDASIFFLNIGIYIPRYTI